MCKQDNACQKEFLIRVWTWFNIQNQLVQLTILKATKIDHLSIVRKNFFYKFQYSFLIKSFIKKKKKTQSEEGYLWKSYRQHLILW